MKLSKFQVVEFKGYNGPTFDPEATLKTLGKSIDNQCKIKSNMIRINSIYSGTTVEQELEELGTKYIDTLDDHYYDIVDSSRRNITLIEAVVGGVTVKATDKGIGKGGAFFELYFPEDYFFEGEVIVGEKNEKYPILIKAVESYGVSQVKYTVQCFGRPNGIPGIELIAGKKFSKEFAPVERGLSREVGGISRPATARVKTFLSTIRIDHKVPGDLDDYGVAFGFPAIDSKGNETVYTALSTYEDWLVEQEFASYKEKALMYGTSNLDENGESYNLGISGREIKFGPGLREYQEQSNKIYYNYFSLDILEETLESISYGKLRLNEKNFTIKTGMGGLKLFHKSVLDRASGWQIISTNNAAVITKTNSELHDNALSAGFQFVEYKAPNGISVKVSLDSSYDDPVRNKIFMPGTMLPAESFRMDIIYKGSKANPNIQKLAYKRFEKVGGEVRGYSAGFRNPLTGELNNEHMSTLEDSATITKFTHLGVAMYDIERCIALIPMILF